VASMGDIVGGTMNEDAGKAQALEVLKVTLGILYSGANKDKVIGLNVESDWADMVTLMKKYSGLAADADPKSFYTNDFLK
jgi:NitT/TauT family transport system substrate-binding protein